MHRCAPVRNRVLRYRMRIIPSTTSSIRSALAVFAMKSREHGGIETYRNRNLFAQHNKVDGSSLQTSLLKCRTNLLQGTPEIKDCIPTHAWVSDSLPEVNNWGQICNYYFSFFFVIHYKTMMVRERKRFLSMERTLGMEYSLGMMSWENNFKSWFSSSEVTKSRNT